MTEKTLKEALDQLVAFAKKLEESLPERSENSNEKPDLVSAAIADIQNSLKPIQRKCKFCEKEYIGLKVICDSEYCRLEWENHLRETDRKYRTNITGMWGSNFPSGSILLQDYIDSKKDNKNK